MKGSSSFEKLKPEVEKIIYPFRRRTMEHPIDPGSLIYRMTPSEIEMLKAEFMLSMKAVDETVVRHINARSYNPCQEMARFTKINSNDEEGRIRQHADKLSEFDIVD